MLKVACIGSDEQMVTNIKLLKKERVANETMAFHWQKPEGFEFEAGQFGDFTLLNPSETDEKGNIRGFSFASAPSEQDLMTATRLRDTAFKRILRNLPVGTELKLDAPYGDFTLHKAVTTPAVFLIGGIGITPVRSIIAQASHDRLPHKIILIYSNKTPDDAPFLNDLEGLAKENPNFTFIPVMTRLQPDEWQGETGHINVELIKKYVPDLNTAIFYLAGPAGMVSAMRKLLVDAQVNEDNIRTEEFLGY